ncbi:MAG: glycoside hydrolase family 88 protein [Alphaproteobacteria bacterium]|jgi:unsaturated chondroitin disaccharide hydrolase|nr:glycoside hydrolase family 88 protein [Alphaproteobacteria bacterium]
MNNQQENLLNELYDKLVVKMESQVQRMGGIFPYSAVGGKYTDRGAENIFWWTNSFWSGILWQMYKATGNDIFKKQAENNELRLDESFDKFYGLHHDVGFTWLHTAAINYRLTNNERSLNRAMHAATLLAGRFNPVGHFIRAWNKPFNGGDTTGYLIIDSMMNLPLLYWASKQTQDPRFEFIAAAHANTVKTKMLRENGSLAHIGNFDAYTGELIETPAGQGYAAGSEWSRGQAWGLYGFALSYRHTKNLEYLDIAQKVAANFISNIEKTDYIALVDFKSPSSPVLYDTSATLCAACGLLELAQYVDADKKQYYTDMAFKIIASTAAKYADWNPQQDGLIGGGAVAYHDKSGHNINLIYGDYFFVEALLRLLKRDTFMWGD